MPSVQIDLADHKQTFSHGKNGSLGKAYTTIQKKLIDSGNYKAAMLMDIVELKSKFGSKYDVAIAKTMAYARCKKYI